MKGNSIMLCDAKGCNKVAKYVRVIKVNNRRQIRFNLCPDCNKLDWVLDGLFVRVLGGKKMTDPKRFTIEQYDYDETMYSEEDSKGKWIFDPDHKIDISKFCDPEDK
jgi:Zn-finger nucleic acid-binding protein